MEGRPLISSADRRARVAVALLFLTNGAIFANLMPRYPAIIEALDLSNAQFGLAVAAVPAGSLASGLLAGILIRRVRSSRVAVGGMVLTSGLVLLAGLAPSWALFAGALFLVGALDSVVDVAQNTHGLRVQRLYGRSIINSFHAIWSLGAVLGGLMGGGAAALDLSLGLHLSISAVTFVIVNLVSYRFLLPGPEPQEPVEAASPGKPALPVRSVAYGALALLAVIAICGATVEDAGGTWAAVYLSGSLGAAPGIAAFGLVAVVGAQFVGRALGDRFVDRWGQAAVARVGGLLIAAGFGLALAFPSVPGTIAGFGLAGFGSATLIPGAMHTADQLPGFRPGTGLTLLSWLLRAGFLCTPPLVGLIADASSLRAGLLVVPIAGLIVVLCSGVFRPDEQRLAR
ncbi:MFS transporter [Herbidospora daliensis]|uniref:MFS transporter n=1 Tax=Herbidospora daliensis TaxID=295585 RepID=UPI0007860D09|nr:MFS transporter [Herbidospora daliensis]